MTVRAPAGHPRLVEPGGLAALRLAVALAHDPMFGAGSRESHVFRSVPRPRSGGAGAPAAAVARVGDGAVPTDVADAAPSIPSPNPPSGPTGELATVMDIRPRDQ